MQIKRNLSKSLLKNTQKQKCEKIKEKTFHSKR